MTKMDEVDEFLSAVLPRQREAEIEILKRRTRTSKITVVPQRPNAKDPMERL